MPYLALLGVIVGTVATLSSFAERDGVGAVLAAVGTVSCFVLALTE